MYHLFYIFCAIEDKCVGRGETSLLSRFPHQNAQQFPPTSTYAKDGGEGGREGGGAAR